MASIYFPGGALAFLADVKFFGLDRHRLAFPGGLLRCLCQPTGKGIFLPATRQQQNIYNNEDQNNFDPRNRTCRPEGGYSISHDAFAPDH